MANRRKRRVRAVMLPIGRTTVELRPLANLHRRACSTCRSRTTSRRFKSRSAIRTSVIPYLLVARGRFQRWNTPFSWTSKSFSRRREVPATQVGWYCGSDTIVMMLVYGGAKRTTRPCPTRQAPSRDSAKDASPHVDHDKAAVVSATLAAGIAEDRSHAETNVLLRNQEERQAQARTFRTGHERDRHDCTRSDHREGHGTGSAGDSATRKDQSGRLDQRAEELVRRSRCCNGVRAVMAARTA